MWTEEQREAWRIYLKTLGAGPFPMSNPGLWQEISDLLDWIESVRDVPISDREFRTACPLPASEVTRVCNLAGLTLTEARDKQLPPKVPPHRKEISGTARKRSVLSSST